MKFLMNPKDTASKQGLKVEFSVETDPPAKSYEWYFQDQPILTEDTDYRGASTAKLIIADCSSKHKGAYKCVATDERGEKLTSKSGYLEIGKFARIYFLNLEFVYPTDCSAQFLVANW